MPFGTLGVGTPSSTVLVPFQFTASATVSSVNIFTSGIAGKDYTQAASGTTCSVGSYAAGQSCVVAVTFTPKFPGQRLGSVVLSSTTGPIAVALLNGSGASPQLVYRIPNGTNSYLASNQNLVGSGFTGPGGGLAVNAEGDVFVGDFSPSGTPTIKEIVASSGVVTANSTVVNIPISVLSNPVAIMVDGAGDLFVDDDAVGATPKVYEIVAGTGGAAPGTVNANSTVLTVYVPSKLTPNAPIAPSAAAVDASGDLFVGGTPYSGTAFDIIELLAGTGGAAPGTVNPNSTVTSVGSSTDILQALAVDSHGDVFASDGNSSSIFEVIAGTGTAAPGTVNGTSSTASLGSGLGAPQMIALDPAGNLYASNPNTGLIQEMLAGTGTAAPGTVNSSSLIVTLGTNGNTPVDLTLDQFGNLFVAAVSQSAISELTYATPPRLTYQLTSLGTPSAAQTVQIANNGNATLDLETPTLAGALNPSLSTNFTYGNSSTCTQVGSSASPFQLTSGSACNLLVSFNPATAGAYGGEVVLTDNALNAAAPTYATQSIPLYGEATLASSTSLSLSASSTQAGSPVTLTATVVDGSSNPITYGTVTFFNGTTPIGLAVIGGAQHTAALTLSSLPVGTLSLSAHYNGDDQYQSSVSAAVPLTVSNSSSTTSLTLSATSVSVGGSLTLTATVLDQSSSPITYGTVTFYNGTTPIGLGVLNSSGVATATSTNFHDIGTTTLTAHFDGNYRDTASTSALQSLTVGGDTNTTTLHLSASTLTVGDLLTMTATVKNSSNNPITYGTVTFYDGSTPIGMGVLNSVGIATLLSSNFHDIGPTTITAHFNGNPTQAASSGS